MSIPRAFVAIVALGLLATPCALAAAPASAACTYVLGFQTLHDLIPQVVGNCVTDEYHNPLNGDGLQQSVGGLLVWRKADNWTAFTDGSTTWINGPFGVQSRPNDQRFPWEAADAGHPVQIQVAFSRHPLSEEDFSAVFPLSRTVNVDGGRVATAALEALIAGPTPAEAAQGYFSELETMVQGPSSCGGADFTLTIDRGLATVTFCRAVVSAGIGQDARAQAEIEATLRQFPSVQRVRLLTREGHCLFDESGLDRCLVG
jgi:hypothetical protein